MNAQAIPMDNRARIVYTLSFVGTVHSIHSYFQIIDYSRPTDQALI